MVSHGKGPSGEQLGDLWQKSDSSVICRKWYYPQQFVSVANGRAFKCHFAVKWQMILWGIKRYLNANSFVRTKRPELSKHMFLFPHQEGIVICVPFPFYDLWCLPLVEMGKWCEIKSPLLYYSYFYCCFSNPMPLKLFFCVRIFLFCNFFIRRHITKIQLHHRC